MNEQLSRSTDRLSHSGPTLLSYSAHTTHDMRHAPYTNERFESVWRVLSATPTMGTLCTAAEADGLAATADGKGRFDWSTPRLAALLVRTNCGLAHCAIA